MRIRRAIKTAAFGSFVIGALGLWGGCGGGDSATKNGSVPAEDPKVLQERGKMISDIYSKQNKK